MAHRRTGGRGGEHSEVTDNFASLMFGDKTASKKFLRLNTDYERGVEQSNKEQTVKRHILTMPELVQKHIR